MRVPVLCGSTFGLCAVLAGGMIAAQDAETARQTATAAAEAPIRANVAAFEKAFNIHDAKAVAMLFSPEAQIIDEGGNTVQGRKEIEQVFAGIFADEPKSKIQIKIESIRYIGTALAVETGSTKTTHGEGETAESSRYTVVHVKARDGKWLMALARDTEGDQATSPEQLTQLEWLIGDWINESPESLVKTSFRWADNKNFILGEFTVQIAGRPAMSGTQRIGWDPVAKKVRSWVFDSQGGFSEGSWTRVADQWIAKSNGVTHDGKFASLTNVYSRINRDRFAIASHDRVVGDEMLPDVDKIMVVRVPPKPAGK
jgi:uncharacterized protein (TIGR02246 family)